MSLRRCVMAGLRPRRRWEQAIVSVVLEAYVNGGIARGRRHRRELVQRASEDSLPGTILNRPVSFALFVLRLRRMSHHRAIWGLRVRVYGRCHDNHNRRH
jgi:hypothetical protein